MPEIEMIEQDIGLMTIPFGPQHPGSGHFHAKIKCEGESVLELTPYPGYLHRGFEKLMEYRTHVQNVMLSDRVCVLDPFPNEIGYLDGVEQIAGIEVPKRAKFIRTVMAELGRILSHVTWGGVMSMALGLDSGTRITWGDREKFIRLQEVITGGRIYPCYLAPGGVRVDFNEEVMDDIRKILDYLEDKMKLYDDLIFYNPTLVARLENVGVLSLEDAVAFGATGPNLRASGMAADVRKDEPYEAYPDVDFDVVTAEKGDAYSRALCRRGEILASISIVRQLLDNMPAGDFRIKWGLTKKTPQGEAYACCEAARGEMCFHVVSDGTAKPYRVKIRGPSFTHALALFPHLVKGAYIADIPAIYWSLDPCPADMDR